MMPIHYLGLFVILVVRDRCFKHNVHYTVRDPLHVPFARHVFKEDPLRMNPGSQINSILFGNTVESP